MASTINASTSPAAIVQTADGTGILALQTGNTTAVTIDASQNVGIGTASPTYKLNIVSTNAGNNSIGLLLTNLSNTSGTGATIGFSPYNDNTTLTGSISNYNEGSSLYSMRFNTWDGSANTERMRIDSSGRVLINRSSGTTYNSEYLGINYTSNAGAGQTINDTTPQSGNSFIRFYNNGSYAGGITSNGTTTMTYGSASDYRLKENAKPIENALDTIAKLNPVTYIWKQTGEKGIGFIAHEIQNIIPDCVVGDKDKIDAEGNPDYQLIDTGSASLIATLTAAIQEQQTIINDLKARVTALEAK